MPVVYDVVDAEYAHIEQIASIARQADIDECWAQVGLPIRDGLRMTLDQSTCARVGRADGVPGVVFGAIDHGVHGGQLWMVGTTLIEKHQRGFLENSRREIEEYRIIYNMLWNYVDVRNLRAIRWLKWLGFTIGERVLYGPFLKPFYLFHWVRQETQP